MPEISNSTSSTPQTIAGIRWDNGDRWTNWRLEESVFGEFQTAGDVILTLSSPYPQRTAVFEYLYRGKWHAESKARSDADGKIVFTPNVLCKENGYWFWCDGAWKHRITVWQRGSSPLLRSRPVTLTFVRDVGDTY